MSFSFTVIISLDIKSSTLYAAIALISSSNFFISSKNIIPCMKFNILGESTWDSFFIMSVSEIIPTTLFSSSTTGSPPIFSFISRFATLAIISFLFATITSVVIISLALLSFILSLLSYSYRVSYCIVLTMRYRYFYF